MKTFTTAALGLAAATVFCVSGADARSPSISFPSGVIPPHLSVAASKYFRAHPEALSALVARLPGRSHPVAPNAMRYLPPTGGAWSYMTGAPSGLCSPHLLHNGNVLAQSCNGSTWYSLTPDSTGSYVNGTWASIASMPVIGGTQYSPLYYASGVLADGRLLVEGGEYNGSGTEVWTNLGAIYNSFTDTWQAVSAPSGVTQIGDSQSATLKTGRFLLGTCCDGPAKDFLFNAGTLTWTATGAPASGGYQDEQGYELLPSGKILTIAVWTNYPSGGANNAEEFNPGTGAWGAAGTMPVSLPDPAGCGTWEIGPAVVRGNHTLVAFGGDTCSGNPVGTDILDTQTGAWTAGPNLPSVCGSGGVTPCDLADAPAALLPNGKILFAASSGYGDVPTHFFEMTLATNTISQVADPLQDSDNLGAYAYNFLVLPTGQIMATNFNVAEVYTPDGTNLAAWAPTVSSAPSTVTRGTTYAITGTQLNGRSAGSYYGDDAQSATNFPTVRIVNTGTGQVVYANTKGFHDFSIAGAAPGSFSFVVPQRAKTGPATLYVVANGIASAGNAITVQ